jgi:hypothetical protein
MASAITFLVSEGRAVEVTLDSRELDALNEHKTLRLISGPDLSGHLCALTIDISDRVSDT